MLWGLRFGDLAIIFLIVMMFGFLWYFARVVKGNYAARASDGYLEEGRRQSELMERQAQALERIATALDQRKL